MKLLLISYIFTHFIFHTVKKSTDVSISHIYEAHTDTDIEASTSPLYQKQEECPDFQEILFRDMMHSFDQ